MNKRGLKILIFLILLSLYSSVSFAEEEKEDPNILCEDIEMELVAKFEWTDEGYIFESTR